MVVWLGRGSKTRTTNHAKSSSKIQYVHNSAVISEFSPCSSQNLACRTISDSIPNVTDNLLATNVEADPKYAGWSPGSTSLVGFAREVSFWRNVDSIRSEPTWERTRRSPNVRFKTLVGWWNDVAIGDWGNWPEKERYERVRNILGPSE